MTKDCLWAAPTAGADSKLEAAVFDALEALGEPYNRHVCYPTSRVGFRSDAHLPLLNLWLEVAGGDSKVYHRRIEQKIAHFRRHPEDGRLLVIYRNAVYRLDAAGRGCGPRSDFQINLARAISQSALDNVQELGDFYDSFLQKP